MSDDTTVLPLRGSCLCGAVRYEVTGAPEGASHCHCSMCRKAHGSAFGSYANVPAEQFRIIRGGGALRSHTSSPGVLRSFCGTCGSPISWMGTQADAAGRVAFTVGTLDTPWNPPRQWHIFTGSKAAWWHIADQWPQHSAA